MEIRNDIEVAVVGRGYIIDWNVGGVHYRKVCVDTAHFGKALQNVINIIREAQARTVQREDQHGPKGEPLSRRSDEPFPELAET